jgi:hypothetical protein
MQWLLFLFTFALGSFLPPFHLRQMLAQTPEGTRVFLWDGVVLMLGLYALILGIEAARRRLRSAAPWTTLALVLAGVAGFAARLGFLTIPR